MALMDRHLGHWSGTAPKTRDIPAPAVMEPVKIFKQMDISQANMYFGHIGVKRSHPDYYALVLVNYTLGGGGFSSRNTE